MRPTLQSADPTITASLQALDVSGDGLEKMWGMGEISAAALFRSWEFAGTQYVREVNTPRVQHVAGAPAADGSRGSLHVGRGCSGWAKNVRESLYVCRWHLVG